MQNAFFVVYERGFDVRAAEIDPDNRVAGLIRAMPVCLEADAALMSCKREKREPTTEEASLIAKANATRAKDDE